MELETIRSALRCWLNSLTIFLIVTFHAYAFFFPSFSPCFWPYSLVSFTVLVEKQVEQLDFRRVKVVSSWGYLPSSDFVLMERNTLFENFGGFVVADFTLVD